MFKKILFSLFITMCLVATPAVAQEETVTESTTVLELPTIEVLEKVPELKQGIIYSLDDQELSYAFTVEVLNYKGISLEGGYSVKDTLLAVASYNLGGLQRFGIDTPITNYLDLNVGYYIGLKDLNDSHERKFDHGVSATLLNIKF